MSLSFPLAKDLGKCKLFPFFMFFFLINGIPIHLCAQAGQRIFALLGALRVDPITPTAYYLQLCNIGFQDTCSDLKPFSHMQGYLSFEHCYMC